MVIRVPASWKYRIYWLHVAGTRAVKILDIQEIYAPWLHSHTVTILR
jgi:hypothetical protein